MSVILKLVLPVIMQIVTELLKPENIRTYGDKFFDLFEDMVKDSKNTLDDATVLPIIKVLRAGLGIPDND